MILLPGAAALHLRNRLRPSRTVLTDARGDLSTADLRGIAELTAGSRRPSDPTAHSALPIDAPLRQVLALGLTAEGHLEIPACESAGETGPPQPGPLTSAHLRPMKDVARRIGLRPGMRVASLVPGTHIHGALIALGALALGAHLVDLTHLRSAQRIDMLRRTSPVVLVGAPVHLADVLSADRARTSGHPLRIRRILAGPDPLPTQLRSELAQRFGARVHELYGTAQAGPLVVDSRALAGVKLREADGTLRVRSPFTGGREVAAGPGGIRARGRIEVGEGSGDAAAVAHGMMHRSPAVTRLLASHPGVARVRLRLLGNGYGTRTLAEVTLTGDGEHAPSAEELRSLVHDRLGAAAVPRHVVLTDTRTEDQDKPGGDEDELSSPAC